PAPVKISCNDPGLKGNGRWLDARRWSYVFEQEPGPGVSCSAELNPSFHTIDNQPITGRTSFSFGTGGPIADVERPYGNVIAEDQVFVLSFNGDVDPASVLAHTHCVVEGLGEAVPVRLIVGQPRTDLLESLYYSRSNVMDSPATQLLQCKRLLPAEARVRLSIGAGVSTPHTPQRPAVASTQAVNVDYQVRKPFTASFNCQRENASMPCTPVTPVSLAFSAPISREDAARIKLTGPDNTVVASDVDPQNAEDRSGVTRITFKGPLAANADFSLALPEGLKDDAGRTLDNAERFPLSFKTAMFPPLVKFSASPFGVVERFAAVPPGGDETDQPATMALAVRKVAPDLMTRDLAVSAGSLSDYNTQDDAEVLNWYARVQRLDERSLTRGQIEDVKAGRKMRSASGDRIDTLRISDLVGVYGALMLTLPCADEQCDLSFDVIGDPLQE